MSDSSLALSHTLCPSLSHLREFTCGPQDLGCCSAICTARCFVLSSARRFQNGWLSCLCPSRSSHVCQQCLRADLGLGLFVPWPPKASDPWRLSSVLPLQAHFRGVSLKFCNCSLLSTAHIGPPGVRLEAEDKAILVHISQPGEGGKMWASDSFNFKYVIVFWQKSSGVTVSVSSDPIACEGEGGEWILKFDSLFFIFFVAKCYN